MRGRLVIHNHFFANTADISRRSSASETGVLREFPISWRGVPEMVLSGSRGGGFTHVRDWAPAFLGLQALFVQVKRLVQPCWGTALLRWSCPGSFCTASPSYMRRTWEEGLLSFCFLSLEVQDLIIQQVMILFPRDVWERETSKGALETSKGALQPQAPGDPSKSRLSVLPLLTRACERQVGVCSLISLSWGQSRQRLGDGPVWYKACGREQTWTEVATGSCSDYTKAFAQVLHTGVFPVLKNYVQTCHGWDWPLQRTVCWSLPCDKFYPKSSYDFEVCLFLSPPTCLIHLPYLDSLIHQTHITSVIHRTI